MRQMRSALLQDRPPSDHCLSLIIFITLLLMLPFIFRAAISPIAFFAACGTGAVTLAAGYAAGSSPPSCRLIAAAAIRQGAFRRSAISAARHGYDAAAADMIRLMPALMLLMPRDV